MPSNSRSWLSDATAAYGSDAVSRLDGNMLSNLDNIFSSISQRIASAKSGNWWSSAAESSWWANEFQSALARLVKQAADQWAEDHKVTSVKLSGSGVAENQDKGVLVGTLSSSGKYGAVDGVTYEMVSTSGGAFRIVGDKVYADQSFDYEMRSSYTLTIKATDSNGKQSWTNLNVSVTDVNEAPDGLQLWWNHVIENQAAGAYVGGLYASDQDRNDRVTFSVVGEHAADFKVVNGNLVTARALDYEGKSTYDVTIRATDSKGLSTDKTFKVYVDDTNDRPTDIVATGLKVAAGAKAGTVAATLDSVDQDAGDNGWFQIVGGRNASDFRIDGDRLVTTKALSAGDEQVTVRVYDKWGQTVDKALVVKVGETVAVNHAPTDLALANGRVAENSAAGTVAGTFSATDSDAGDSHVFSIVGGKDAASFEIRGAQLLAKASFDYEAGGTKEIVVRATDKAGAFVDRAVTVAVGDVNEAPVSVALAGGTVAENLAAGALVGTLSGTDPDKGDVLSFSVVGGRDAASFKVVGNTLVTTGALDYEAGAAREVVLRATDKAGLSVDKTVTVAVADVNEAPVSVALSGGAVAENRAAGTVVGMLSGTDPDGGDVLSFSVAGGRDADGFKVVGDKLVTTGSFDHEAGATREVVLRATDKAGLSVEKTFVVAVQNVNEAPDSLDFAPAEVVYLRQSAGTTVGQLAAHDPDAGDRLTYSVVGGADGALFGTDGARLVTLAPLTGAERDFEVVVRATDAGGLHVDRTVLVHAVPSPSAVTSVSLSDALIEGSVAAGTVVGRLSATDTDPGLAITFAVTGGRNAADFAVDAQGNLVTTRPLSHAQGSLRDVTVTATDSNGASSTVGFAVTVADAAPTEMTFVSNGFLYANEGPGELVGSFFTADPDAGETFTYRITGGADAALFTLDAAGNLYTTQPLGYNGGQARHVSVQVTDSGGMSLGPSDFEFRAMATAPTDIVVTGGTISDGAAAGTVAATLAALGLDPTDWATFTIMGGSGASFFEIRGDQLVVKTPLGHLQTGGDVNLVIRATELDGAFVERVMHVAIAPPDAQDGEVTEVTLDKHSIMEGMPSGHVVGHLSAVDSAGLGVTFEIVGGAHADAFAVNADGDLVATRSLSAGMDPSALDVVVRATDSSGAHLDQAFSVALQPVALILGGGYVESVPDMPTAFGPFFDMLEIHGFKEGKGDQIWLGAYLEQSAIDLSKVRFEGSFDNHVEVQVDDGFGGGFVTVATLEDAVSSNGLLDGDGVADPVSRAQLDALAADWISSHVVHS